MKSETMKERPIIFSAPMIRAILDGRKTQTRRVVKPQPEPWKGHAGEQGGCVSDWSVCCNGGWWWMNCATVPSHRIGECPYGRVEDRLWVKENFYCDHVDYAHGGSIAGANYEGDGLYYIADARPDARRWCCDLIPECSCGEVGKPRVRPSIHMPRWASRITLELTDVRVQRVQDISEADAIAEGVSPGEASDGGFSYVLGFSDLWDSINAKRGFAWESNPWVWALTFRRVKGGGE